MKTAIALALSIASIVVTITTRIDMDDLYTGQSAAHHHMKKRSNKVQVHESCDLADDIPCIEWDRSGG